jgi:hypothetical protein
MNIVDQYSDPAFGTLYRQAARMPALAEFVKEASVDPGDANSLPDTAFAWPSERKFPIHTPEHAALSYAYSKVASQLPAGVEENLKKALEVYSVPESTFVEPDEKTASNNTDDDYLLPAHQLFPVQTEVQCKLAQDRVIESLPKLDLESRAIACANLVKKAAHFNVELRPEIQKLAGLVVSNTKTAQQWLEARAEQLPATDTTHKTAYLTLAKEFGKQREETADRPGLLKVAAAIAELDEKTGLDRHYDRRLPDALRTVFNTEKVASKSVDLGGTYISVSKLAQLPASFWEDLGGKELGDEIAPGGVVDQSKLATVVDTLPLDLKLQLKAHCR